MNPPTGPRASHLLDQFLAYNLEVQARLKAFEEDLRKAGYSKAEAWALARELEERLLGPAMDLASKQLRVEDAVDKVVRRRLEELEGGAGGET